MKSLRGLGLAFITNFSRSERLHHFKVSWKSNTKLTHSGAKGELLPSILAAMDISALALKEWLGVWRQASGFVSARVG